MKFEILKEKEECKYKRLKKKMEKQTSKAGFSEKPRESERGKKMQDNIQLMIDTWHVRNKVKIIYYINFLNL